MNQILSNLWLKSSTVKSKIIKNIKLVFVKLKHKLHLDSLNY